MENPQALTEPVIPIVNPVGKNITAEHVSHIEQFLDAAKAIYDEIMGQSAHERLQNARQALHQVYIQGAPALQALRDELEAIKAAVAKSKTVSKDVQ